MATVSTSALPVAQNASEDKAAVEKHCLYGFLKEREPEFQLIFTNPSYNTAFKLFCSNRKIDEILLFIDAVVNYKNACANVTFSTESLLFQQSAHIVTTFIKLGAPSELNIDSNMREQTLNSFFKLISTPNTSVDTLTTLFDRMIDELLLQLSSEHFPAFLASPYYAGLCEYHKLQLPVTNNNNNNNAKSFHASSSSSLPPQQEKTAVATSPQSPSFGSPTTPSSAASPQQNLIQKQTITLSNNLPSNSRKPSVEDKISHNVEEQSELYNMVDMSTPKFTEQDFVKLVALTKEDPSLWKPLVKKGDMTTFCSRTKFTLDKKKGIRIFRIYAEYEYPILDVARTMLAREFRLIHDGNLTEQKHIDYIPSSETNPFAVSITHERYKLVWPLSDRDMVFCASMRHDPSNKRYILCRKTCKHEKAPHVKGVVRAACFAGFVFEEMSATRCRVHQIAFCDFAGFIPTKVWNFILSKRGDESHLAVLKLLKQQKQKGFPAPLDIDRWWETLAENSMNAMKMQQKQAAAQEAKVSKELLSAITKRLSMPPNSGIRLGSNSSSANETNSSSAIDEDGSQQLEKQYGSSIGSTGTSVSSETSSPTLKSALAAEEIK